MLDILKKPRTWVALTALVYVVGVAIRFNYHFNVQSPDTFVYADMRFYTELAERLATSKEPLGPWDMLVPPAYPYFLSLMRGADGSLAVAGFVQLIMSCLTPLAVGLLGWTAFGRRTAMAAVAFASLYFPFIEFGAYRLTETPFILSYALAFAAFFAARNARTLRKSLVLGAVGGVMLSVAMAVKSVALLGALAYFAAEAIGLAVSRARTGLSWRAQLQPWILRTAVAIVATLPLVIPMARVCTRASGGNFCVTGNKVGSDFLLGHYGRIADIQWNAPDGHGFRFGSPSSWLRHYDNHVVVDFAMFDNKRNTAEAWKWVRENPGEAIVISLDHIYDAFFGYTMWPTFNGPRWAAAQLSQYAFVLFLFVPTVLVCARVIKRGWRGALTSRAFLALAPIAAIAFTVALATGEVRYRIPFDIFFIVTACSLPVREVDNDVPAPGIAEPAIQS